MKKWLNKILHDKNDYHLDPELQNSNDAYNYFFQKTLEFQKYLILHKIRYFLKYDKLVLLRIFLRYIIRLVIFLVIVGVIIFALDFFNIVDVKPVQKEYVEYTVYIPDTVDIEKYKENIDNPKVNFVIFFVEDSTKDYKMWKDKLSQIESGNYDNQYEARRMEKDENGNSFYSQYWGKYQMGRQARSLVGAGSFSWEDWKSSPDLQEGIMDLWVNTLYDDLKSEIDRYNGKFIGGWQITTSGLIAMVPL